LQSKPGFKTLSFYDKYSESYSTNAEIILNLSVICDDEHSWDINDKIEFSR